MRTAGQRIEQSGQTTGDPEPVARRIRRSTSTSTRAIRVVADRLPFPPPSPPPDDLHPRIMTTFSKPVVATDQPKRAPYRYIKRSPPTAKGASAKLVKSVPMESVRASLYGKPDENMTCRPRHCCSGNHCLSRLLCDLDPCESATPADLARREAFISAVSTTRMGLYRDGQNKGRDRLLAKLRLSYQPSHTSCPATEGYSYMGSQPAVNEGGVTYWWFTPDGGSVRVCREAWRLVHACSETRLCALARDIKRLPLDYKRASSPRDGRRAADVRAWLDDNFAPENGRCEKMPNPESGREEWHLPPWLKKSVVYKEHCKECKEFNGRPQKLEYDSSSLDIYTIYRCNACLRGETMP